MVDSPPVHKASGMDCSVLSERRRLLVDGGLQLSGIDFLSAAQLHQHFAGNQVVCLFAECGLFQPVPTLDNAAVLCEYLLCLREDSMDLAADGLFAVGLGLLQLGCTYPDLWLKRVGLACFVEHGLRTFVVLELGKRQPQRHLMRQALHSFVKERLSLGWLLFINQLFP